MRIALATCSTLPDWEVDDRPLHRALQERGADLAQPAWDEPSVDWSGFDACLIRTTWDYMERRAAYVDWAERTAQRTRLFNPPAVVRWNTHKRYLRELEREGVPVIPTVWMEAGTDVDLRSVLAERGWRRALLKPMVGACAREALPFDARPEELARAQAHLDRTLAREGMMLQPYLERVETEGELSAVFLDGAFSHAVRKVPVPGDFRVQDDYGARDEPFELPPAEGELVDRIASLAGRALSRAAGTRIADLLYARVDLLRDDSGSLRLTELELVEPSLFFRHAPEAAGRLAGALLGRLRAG